MVYKYFTCFLLASALLLSSGCTKADKNVSPNNNPPVTTDPPKTELKTRIGKGNADYKVYYQETNKVIDKKGLIILAVGDGATHENTTLNAQCEALAKKGFVAVTAGYRPSPNTTYEAWIVQFKKDIELIIKQEGSALSISRDKVVIGGLSRGGNLTFGLILPGQMGSEPPIAGIKGAILECAGGDKWKGSAILFPVLYMSNETDNSVGADASAFVSGWAENTNPRVKAASKSLIIPGEGHCSRSGEYLDFIIKNIDSWY